MKINVILFSLLILVTSAQANDPTCTAPPVSLEKQLMDSIGDANAPIADQASCDAANLAQAQKEFKTRFPDDRVQSTKDVDGITLQGSPDEITFAREVIEGHGKGDRPPKSWPAVAAGCSTVVCGLSKLLGSDESAYRVLNIAQRSGYVVSATQEGNPVGVEQIWKVSEIRSIDHVTAGAPDQYQHLGSMKYFKRCADGVKSEDVRDGTPGAAAWADSGRQEIVLFSSVFTPLDFTEPAIFHELSHHYDYQGLDHAPYTELSTTMGFTKISGWDNGTNVQVLNKDGSPTGTVKTVYTHAPDATFVSAYAGTAPLEDFAESCANYRYSPNDLKIASPEKYQLLKDKVFKGVEFTESGGWPALDKQLVALGGMSGLVAACVSKIDHIVASKKTPQVWMFNPGSTTNLTSLTPLTRMASLCLKSTEDQVIAQIQSDSTYCSRGGDQFVRDAMERTIDGSFVDLINAAWNTTLETSDADLQCQKDKDLTHNCSVVKSLQKNPTFLRLGQADQKSISDQFEKLVPLGKAVNDDIVQKFPVQNLLQTCLTAIDSISVNDGEVSYLKQSPTETMESFAYYQDKNCESGIQNAFTAAGYKSNDDFVTKTLRGSDLQSTFASFEKEVLVVWSPAQATKLVTDWATKQGFDGKALSDALVPYLLSHVKVGSASAE